MTAPRLENDAEVAAEPHVLVDARGERLVLVAKATFLLRTGPPRGNDGSFELAPRDLRRPIRAADVPWGKPEIASVLYPSDLCAFKPSTDVVVVARAHAPRGAAVPRFDAGVRLASASKSIVVTGPRVWIGPGEGVTEPTPTTSLDVRWDYAFGGFDDAGDEGPVEEPRNPIGRGIAGDPSSLEGKPAPQLEHPLAPVARADARPEPASLGPIGRHFAPRRALFGTYGLRWLEERAPLPPTDFDPRANHCAPPELITRAPLQGGEEGALLNLTPHGGTVPFVLPRLALRSRFEVKGRAHEEVRPVLDTVVLDTLAPALSPAHRASAMVLELVWRCSVAAPRRPGDATIHLWEARQP